MPNPVIEHVFVDNVTYDVKDIYAERAENKASSFIENETNDRYPSALLVKSLLDRKAEAGNLVTSEDGFDSVPSDSKYPSEKLVKDALDGKEDSANKVTVFQDTPTHTAYPSEKLVYDSLAAQKTIVVDQLPNVAEAVETCDYILKNGTAGVLYKVINGAWAPVGASNAQVLNELPASGDVYTDYYVQNASGVYLHYRWDGSDFYEVGSDAYSKSQADAKFEILDNKVTAFQVTPTDTAYPSEKLVKDTLDALQTTLSGAINSSTTVVNELPSVASADSNRNYVLLQGSGALLYRVINGAWKMVGGAMVSVVDDLPQNGDAFTDYYVATEDPEIYLHYRWMDSYEDNGETVAAHFYAVGADAYSKAEIDEMITADRNRLTTVEGTASTLGGKVSTLEAQIGSFSNMVDNVESAGTTVGGVTITYKNGTTSHVPTYDVRKRVEEVQKSASGLEITYTDGTTDEIEITGGGGGGSDTGSATITRVTAADATCVYGEEFNIQYRFEASDSAGDQVGSGTATWYVGNVRVATSTALQNVVNNFDIGPYLAVGSNNVRISVSVDTGGDTPLVRTKTWTINCVNMYIEWDYDETTINTADQVSIRWVPYGNVSKTTYIVIDGDTNNPITSTTSRSGVQQFVTINKLSHGSHHVVMYCEATINNVTIQSTIVEHDMIFADVESTVPIIACQVEQATVTQYNTIALPVVIYTPGSLTSNAVLNVDGVTTAEWENVDRTVHVWNYTPNTSGVRVLTITSGGVIKTITLTVTPLNIDNEEIGGYSFRLKASDLAGNDALRAWSSNGVTATFSNNFDWSNGGIKSETDDNGNLQQYICVKTGTRMTINYPMFADDAVVNGKTFKIIFKVVNCRDYSAQIASCYSDGIGVQMTAHQATMSSSGTTVNVPYGEDEYIELEFDVYPAPRAENDGNFRYIMAWLDGVITSFRDYKSSDNFTQTDQQNIVIGSDDCDVYVYMVKEYPNYMTRSNHIENFIADAPNAQEMVKRFNRNDILDTTGEIDYTKLAENNPDCRVWLYDIPYLTNGKKDKVKNCTFQQIWHNGKKYYQLTGTGTMTVQGTSSVKYIRGAANTDINFKQLYDGDNHDLLANGTEDETYGNNWYVEDDENPGHAKVFEVESGDVLGPECIAVERDANRNITKYIKALGYKINDDSCPITYSNTKVNFASCEQVNNMCNAIWYQRYNPYPSLTPRDCMEFSMGVQFIKDRGDIPDDSHFVLFDNDNKYHMYSIANMGTSKKNVHVFHDLSNPNEVCIEVNDNNAEQMRMVNDDLSAEDWSGDVYFGMRYPDTKNPSQEIKDAWQRLVTWFATSNPNAATGDALPHAETYENYTFRGHDRAGTQVLRGTTVKKYAGTYTNDTFERRMAKMLSECEDYMVMDSFIYHFVYLERHTMVDNVSKNNFWSSTDLIHWDLSKAYDMDTSDGNNNQGQMVFDYGNEYDDSIGEKMVFNGGDSVWFVFCANLYEACQTMFINREALGAWSSTAYHNFLLSEQRKVPERVWVQCYWYDYLRTFEEGISDEWMTFLDGGQKTHQRKHYEYFEELYDSSKYRGSVSTSQNVNFRAYKPSAWAGVEPKSQITITMYNKMYISLDAGTTAVEPIKAERGIPYTINFPVEVDVGGTQVAINTATMIQAISGLEQLYPDTCVFSNAIRLRTLAIGSNATGYQNTFLTNLGLTNNRMLEYLYVQNLPNANTGLNLSNCPSLKYVDATGAGFTAYDFAVGGVLETAYLEAPVSITFRDLQYLTDANLHILNYSNLATLRLENCPGINSLTLVNNAVNLNRARILGVDWSLIDTTVLNRLLAMIGIDANGYNTPVSVLSGSAYVSGVIRSVELENYDEAWDNLEVTYNSENLIRQYIVTYKNYDGEVLYRYAVDRGSYPPNPVTQGWIDPPTRASDEQYIYTYRGWDSLSTVVTEARDVFAIYSTTTRTYNVVWYKKQGDITPLDSATCAYGSSVSYSGDIPAAENNESLGTYRAFTGWDKSTGFVREDMNVYGLWESAYYPSNEKELNEMSAAEIFAVSAMKNTTRFEVKDYFELEHGHDFDFSNVESEVLAEEMFFDGDGADAINPYYDTGVSLFSSGESFTLALDYEYLMDCNSGGALASCFDGLSGAGFVLNFLKQNSVVYPRITWMGGNPRRVGNACQHNIIVIRYSKNNPNNLIVYSFNGASDRSSVNVYDSQIATILINGTTSPTNSDTLVFGANKYVDNNITYYANYAKGWIHWAKIWYDDLGEDNCRLLASWPHEKTRMEYAGPNRQTLSGTAGLTACTAFYANNLLPLLYKYSESGYETTTWHGSALEEFFENRVFKGLSYRWQSVIKSVKIVTSVGNNSSTTVTSDGHLYPPACIEVDSSVTASQYSVENMVGYIPGLFGASSYSMSTRWSGAVIEDRKNNVIGRRVFTSQDDPSTGNICGDGDIWSKTGGNPRWWMFVSEETASKHSMIGSRLMYEVNDSYNLLPASNGGFWVRCEGWWTRSPDATNYSQFRFRNYFGDYFGSASYSSENGLLIGLSI